MINCPHCGSTQVKQLIGNAYICECEELFYMVNNEPKTASQICEEINRAEQKVFVDGMECPICGSTTNPRLKQIDEQELNCYTIEVTRTYECGCGQVFISKEYKNNT